MRFVRKNMKLIIGLVIGAIITYSITAYAYTYFSTDVVYKRNGKAMSVEDALDDLYKKTQKYDRGVIFVASSWKQGVSWNNYGLSDILVLNPDYIENSYNSDSVYAKIKTDCKIKITGYLRNTDQPNSAPKYKLTYNGQEILSFSNSAAAEAYTRNEVEISAKQNDTFYVSMYGGGGNPTYYITWVELVD